VAGALVRSSDEFGLGVNAVSEKREALQPSAKRLANDILKD
jgi:hypothetical protein